MILQDILKLPVSKAHISMLNEEQCELLIRRLETGQYWIGAGLRLKADRPTIWHRKKKPCIYETIEKIRKQTKGKIQQGSKKTKIFRKYKKGMEPDWKSCDQLREICDIMKKQPYPHNSFL